MAFPVTAERGGHAEALSSGAANSTTKTNDGSHDNRDACTFNGNREETRMQEKGQELSRVRLAARHARLASQRLQTSTLEERNAALVAYKEGLLHFREEIEAANARDIEAATAAVSAGEISSALLKRLDCRGKKFESLLHGLDTLIAQGDPLGTCDLATELAADLELFRVSCPIGVLAVIYEARPEAAVQVASLALKTGNALLLKGGKEAKESNRAVYKALTWGLEKATTSSISKDALQLLEERDEVKEMLRLDEDVDLVIPRGSNSLVKYIKENTRIPVLGHADGLCHIYVDADADLGKALKIIEDAKLQYVAACNTVESLLVHSAVPSKFLPSLVSSLAPLGVSFKLDSLAFSFVEAHGDEVLEKHGGALARANEQDFHTEWLAPVLSVKVVGSLEDAIAHINSHGSHHTDCIITENREHVQRFMRGVDSAGVYCNCSTRFADGYRYGFGAEVGVSTNKLHARGPVGVHGLVTYKYCLFGDGHTVADFEAGRTSYTHRPLDREEVAESKRKLSTLEEIEERELQRKHQN
ncbi:putative gamma-glutamyl phosphate reductase [Besnoitia besnoiti]|uniref:glutamate-5-semialdehyde dehydrogenase n=1 Tax=Besnoitia besnoiti TaxID=94643 RepID=A0A2A9MJD2_BESBE|nr:putative gamma-glutamyl phosphate reductase [Besnoitia besnoiti]PFH35707.1 putative gamma-glutamyl phosphate reductase [Besnoitia besnoiti]